jgi:hypothetical protein
MLRSGHARDPTWCHAREGAAQMRYQPHFATTPRAPSHGLMIQPSRRQQPTASSVRLAVAPRRGAGQSSGLQRGLDVPAYRCCVLPASSLLPASLPCLLAPSVQLSIPPVRPSLHPSVRPFFRPSTRRSVGRCVSPLHPWRCRYPLPPSLPPSLSLPSLVATPSLPFRSSVCPSVGCWVDHLGSYF